MWQLDDYPLVEEIGDPDLFVGREKEMTRLLDWAAGAKRLHSKSMGILSRRKKGKTALLQRFFNILFTRNDPQLIPFYYRIPEDRQTKPDFAESFYRRTLTQYFAFTTRRPDWLGTLLTMEELKELANSDPYIADDIRRMEDVLESTRTSAWNFAQEAAHRISAAKDVRILQILDEFQYMNKYIFSEAEPRRVELLCHSYMGPAESKVSPQIVAGSYIGWLTEILRHLTARYRRWHLGGFTDEEALEAVYTYAYAYRVPITGETAPYIAEVCFNDPFYIAATIANLPAEKDLTTGQGVRDALTFETSIENGEIAHTWGEYLADAIKRVNDQNAHRIVLYLAKHEPEERDRTQILEDLKLDMTDQKLAERLKKLVRADILAQGSSNFRYRGLGDRIFAMVFRRIYGEEIQRVSVAQIDEDFKREIAGLKGRLSVQKGVLAEHRVRYRLLVAAHSGVTQKGVTLPDLVQAPLPEGVDSDTPIGPFKGIRKARVFLDQDTSVEIDLHAVHMDENGTDLMIEVKDWEKGPTLDVVRRFIEVKQALEGRLERATVFLFYSESRLSEDAAMLLHEAAVLVLDPEKLDGFEVF